MKWELARKILEVTAGLGDAALNLGAIHDLIVIPPQEEMGHLAFGVFPLAKSLRMPPPAIAQKIADGLKPQEGQFFSQVQAVGPYVNFFMSPEALGKYVAIPVLKGDYFKHKLKVHAPKTMIEYSQPNTHKELHVGHMRNACLGSALVRIMRYSGYDVITSTFPGDVGTHVAKCLWYLKFHNTQPIPEKDKGEWLGRMYSLGHLKLEDDQGTPQEEINNRELSEVLKQLEAKTGEYYELWRQTRQWSIDLMKQVYQWSDIEFDHWYWESDVDSDSVKWVKELYAEGKLTMSEGAVGMDLSADNLGFCLLLKKDGNGLYATKDLELARRKFQDYNIEHSIYVVDMRQALHFKQVFKVLEKLGFAQAKGFYHLQYNFVELPDGAMSSRKGNIVPIMDLISQMVETVKTNYLSRYKGEWSEQEIDTIANIVAKGAIKYGMLKMDPNKKIVFDMAEWLRLDGESGPYIQYAYARIQSLLRKFEEQAGLKQALAELKTTDNPKLFSSLHHKHELLLAVHINHLNSIVLASAEQHKPSLLANYLYDLAKRFSGFYQECPIGTAESPQLQQARLLLAYTTGEALKQGLGLLGIPVPAKM